MNKLKCRNVNIQMREEKMAFLNVKEGSSLQDGGTAFLLITAPLSALLSAMYLLEYRTIEWLKQFSVLSF